MMEGGSRLLLGGEKSCGGPLHSPLSARRLYLRNKISRFKAGSSCPQTLSDTAEPGGAQ